MSDQLSFSDAEQDTKRKKTRSEVFLDEMEKVVPWAALEAVIEPRYPRAGKSRHPYPLSKMLRIHLMQQWYALSDPAMKESLYEIASMRRFARLSLARGTILDETTILNFLHLLERHSLAERILVMVASDLLNGEEEMVFADAGYQGVANRTENTGKNVVRHVAMRPGKRRALGASRHAPNFDQIERIKAQVRAKGEHAFRMVKRQLGYTKVRYRGLAKNPAQLRTPFALANLWIVRRALKNTG